MDCCSLRALRGEEGAGIRDWTAIEDREAIFTHRWPTTGNLGVKRVNDDQTERQDCRGR